MAGCGCMSTAIAAGRKPRAAGAQAKRRRQQPDMKEFAALIAIHVAQALQLKAAEFATKDSRQAALARAAGLRVLMP